MRISRKQFDSLVAAEVKALMDSLPEDMKGPAIEVLFVTADRPSPDQMEHADDEFDLLGLYEGTPLPQRSVSDGPHPIQDRITLFRYPLADSCDSIRELKEEIRMTLIHELGHFFGFDEEELEEKGLA